MRRLTIAAPLALEAALVRSAGTRARVLHTGMGPRRARRAAGRLAAEDGDAFAVMGFCGALDPALRAGEIVVASELRGADGTLALPGAELIAGTLRRRGIAARSGPIVSVARIARGAERARLAGTGAVAVDMESAWLAAGAHGRPLAVLRAVVDGPGRELSAPLATVAGAWRASVALRRAAPVVAEWAAATRSRHVVLAGPRASCAGVDRAIGIVEAALEARGAPVYVRRQIVHNRHVVAELEGRGAIFVEELDAVPRGATVVFSAHGVSPAVRGEALARGLEVIDATCPLVNKVHAEARRFAQRGKTVVLVGHETHEEVEGVIGEAPASIQVVPDLAAVERLEVSDPEQVAYLTQTTLAVDETRVVVDALRRRFPALAGPASDDICYATQNRQDAVRAIAADCDRMLVIGSENSSNSRRLVEVAERHGCPARLIEDESAIDLAWLAPAATVGVTAGASAREKLVQRVLEALSGLGSVDVEERTVTRETLQFKLSAGLTKRG